MAKNDEESSGTIESSNWLDRLNPFTRRKKPVVPDERQTCPEHTANFFSLLTFSWMSPILYVGYLRPLELNDIWKINPSRSTVILSEKLKVSFFKNHEKGLKRPLVRAIFTTFKNDLIIGGLASLLSSLIQVLVPFVIKYIIAFSGKAWYSQYEHTPAPPISHGIGLLIGITVLQILGSIGNQHFFYRGTIVGGEVRSCLISIIFDKAMTISSRAKAGTVQVESPPAGIKPGSDDEKQHFEKQLPEEKQKKEKSKGWDNGRIVNLMSVDTFRVDKASGWMHLSWSSPLAMIVTIILLIINLTYSALVGIAVFFLVAPVLGKSIKLLFSRRKTINTLTDSRVSITQEALQAIRFIKYYGWEGEFMRRIAAVRKGEIRSIRIMLTIRNIANSIGNAIPIFASMLTFVTYSLTNHALDPAPVFSSLALFNQLRMPMIVLPMILAMMADALQSIDRIEEFLLSEDTKDTIKTVAEGESEYALELSDAAFTWEQSGPPDKSAEGGGKPTRAQMIKAMQEAKQAKLEAKKKKKKSTKGAEATVTQAEENVPPQTPPFSITDVNLRVRRGELIGVVGGVGSGKSSLLAAIAGEMRQVAGSAIASGTRALCPQVAWIQNATALDNVIFGREFDQTRYDQVIEACSLVHDMQVLPHGNLTEIGERGINLSGGQKHRVSLARAIYFDADIILLDDPLAAVDAHVGVHIMVNAICGLLKEKCRILATHQLQVLHRCDRIAIMDKGKIIACDTFEKLMADNDTFKMMMAKTDSDPAKKDSVRDEKVDNNELKPEKVAQKSQKALMQEEDRAVDNIAWSVYADYWRSTGSILILPFVLLTLAIGQGANIVTNLWLAWWSANQFKYPTGTYVGVYAALGIAQFLLLFTFSLTLTVFGTEASKRMLRRAIHRVLRAPISFFDTTPLGRIMNRLSKDIDIMDNNLTESMRVAGTTAASLISTFILIIAYYYYFAVALVPLLTFFLLISAYYRASAREIKRHESVLRSSVFSQFSEAISGVATLRAYGVQETFSNKLLTAIDDMDSAYYLTFANQRWLCCRLDAISVLFFLVTGILIITNRFAINPAISGLILSYLVAINSLLVFTVRQVAEMENNMNATERIHYYGRNIPEEAAENTESFDLPKEWPQRGEIVLENVEMRYREGLPLILKGLNLHILAGERIGIVGRTGAGKSSIMVALFRLVELTSGSIEVDNIDISTVGLQDLRSRISIIPQDPTLFKGTVRSNLDPLGEHSDLDLWTALRQAHLVETDKDQSGNGNGNSITLESAVENEGTNFSLGQRQLLALARVLVRGSQIIVCDEATSSIDFESDRKVQQTIMDGFKGKTLLCIAHRLKTIIGYDRVCVVDEGMVAELDTPLLLFDRGGAFRKMCDQSNIGREEILQAQMDVHRA